jgi:5-methylcytosine-specific restriction endonuclease McrA
MIIAQTAVAKEIRLAGLEIMNRKLCGCGNLVTSKGRDKTGNQVYRSSCNTCHKTGQRTKGTSCIRCGFIAEDSVQLDVDHIDGNRSNNSPDNLQTLCANCHRLKTKINNDWMKNEKVR